MATKFTKKETFFKFEKEIYNPETEKFTIPNLESEKERLDGWVGDETLKISQEEDLDVKAHYTNEYLKETKKIQKEIADKKSELTKTHLKDLQSELEELNKYLKDIDEQTKSAVGDALAKAGRINEFYVAPSFSIRTSKTTNIETIQLAITFLNQLGLDVKLYDNNDKVLKNGLEDVKTAQKDAKDHHAEGYFSEDDVNDFDDGRSA